MVARKSAGMAMIVLMAVAALLSACGSNPAEQQESLPSGGSDAPASAETQGSDMAAEPQMRTFEDAQGREVEIPAHPQRVIIMQYAGDALALGLRPVGAADYLLDQLPEELAGVEGVGDTLLGSPEKMVTLDPDLILHMDYADSADIEKLSKVAPTVTVAWDNNMYGHLRIIGDILGKTQEAEDWISAYEAKAADTRERIKPYIKESETALALRYDGKNIWLFGAQNIADTLYKALGMAIPPGVQKLIDENKANNVVLNVSMEKLPEFSADHIFISIEDDADTQAKFEELISGGIWRGLKAVKDGHAYALGKRWSNYDALTLDWELDDIVRVLSAE